MGLVCLTFVLSFVTAHSNARLPPVYRSLQGKQRHWAATTLQVKRQKKGEQKRAHAPRQKWERFYILFNGGGGS